jgi:hypothetical protein
MERRQFLLVACPSMLLALAAFVLGGVLDSSALYIVGLGFSTIVVAARKAFLDDVIMGGLILVAFVAFVVLLIVN